MLYLGVKYVCSHLLSVYSQKTFQEMNNDVGGSSTLKTNETTGGSNGGSSKAQQASKSDSRKVTFDETDGGKPKSKKKRNSTVPSQNSMYKNPLTPFNDHLLIVFLFRRGRAFGFGYCTSWKQSNRQGEEGNDHAFYDNQRRSCSS